MLGLGSMALEDDLARLQERVAATRDELRRAHDAVRPLTEGLKAALARVTDSWSGSFAGYHARLYFRDFQPPSWHESFSPEWGAIRGLPDGWDERTSDEVQTIVETFAGARIATVEEAAEPVAHALDVLRDDIAVTVAPIRYLPTLAREAEMLDALEKMPLRVQLHEYLNISMGGVRTRDSHAASQGIRIPAHLYFEAQLTQATSVFTKGEAFLRAAERLIRQIRSQHEFLVTRTLPPTDSVDRVVRICERFHRVALRLRMRHQGRPRFEVKDEYDVQDLLDALLQTEFDDVRREERSPSHAGSAPAIDFLLKAEQLAIEVKMARDSMTAKTLGDELLADIGRYAEHPDCRSLVCFVYDPESRLKNPSGVERDLESHSRDGLRVIAIIAPR